MSDNKRIVITMAGKEIKSLSSIKYSIGPKWYTSFDDKEKTTRWERFKLIFFKRRNYTIDGHVMVYKIMRGRIFFIDDWVIPQGYHCRSEIVPIKKCIK